MARLRVPVLDLTSGERWLDERASQYLVAVHRKKAEDAFDAFDPVQGLTAEGVLVRVERRKAYCHIGPLREAERIPRLPLVLVQALAKGEKIDDVVRVATVLGVTRLVLVETERTIVRIDSGRGQDRRERWQWLAIEAARQSGRGDIPRLDGPLQLTELSSMLPELPTHRLALTIDAESNLASWLSTHPPGPTTLFIGPEGGLSPAEVSGLRPQGFLPVRFGDLVMRAEVVTPAVLGALLSWREPTSG